MSKLIFGNDILHLIYYDAIPDRLVSLRSMWSLQLWLSVALLKLASLSSSNESYCLKELSHLWDLQLHIKCKSFVKSAKESVKEPCAVKLQTAPCDSADSAPSSYETP